MNPSRRKITQSSCGIRSSSGHHTRGWPTSIGQHPVRRRRLHHTGWHPTKERPLRRRPLAAPSCRMPATLPDGWDNPVVSHPWTSPEFVSLGRLPMHAVRHHDAVARRHVAVPAARRPRRRTSRRTPGATSTSRAAGPSRTPGTRRSTRTSRCRSRVAAGPSRRATRPGSTSGRSTSRRTGRTAGSSSTSGPPRACCSSVNGADVGDQQGLAPRGRVRPHRPRPAGPNDAAADASSSGPTRRTSRTRTSGGTAASPARLPVRDRAGLSRRRRRRSPASADDLATGHARADRRSRRSPASSRRPAGRSRRRSPGCSAPAARTVPARRAAPDRPPIPTEQDLMRRHAVGGPADGRRARRDWAALDRRLVPPLGGRVAFDARASRASSRGPPSRPIAPRPRRRAPAPGRRGRRASRRSGSASGASRSAASTCSSTARGSSSAASTATTSTSTPGGSSRSSRCAPTSSR